MDCRIISGVLVRINGKKTFMSADIYDGCVFVKRETRAVNTLQENVQDDGRILQINTMSWSDTVILAYRLSPSNHFSVFEQSN